MFTDIFFKAINGVWPMVFIFTIILVTIRLAYLICNKKKFVLYKELTTLCFIIYILLLYYIVTFQDNNYGTNNFIPFKEILRYKPFSILFIKNVLGNILLFVPFGIFVSLYVNKKSFLPVFLISLITSVSIEFTQTIIGRTADVDDVMLNVLGGLIGYFLLYGAKELTKDLPEFMKKDYFLNTLVIILIIIIGYLFIKLKWWRLLVWIM